MLSHTKDARGEWIGKPSPGFGYLFRTWLRQSWDEMGPLIAGSFLWCALGAIGFGAARLYMGVVSEVPRVVENPVISILVPSFIWLWTLSLGWCVLNGYVERILTFQHPTWRFLITSTARFLFPSLWVALYLGIGLGAVGFNLVVYQDMFRGAPALRVGAVTLTLWIGVFLLMIQVHLVPFLVHQDKPFLVALKRAAMVAVWKPFRTLSILALGVLLLPLMAFPPMCFLTPGVFAVLSNLSLLILLEEWRDPYEKTPEAIRAGA